MYIAFILEIRASAFKILLIIYFNLNAFFNHKD